MARISIITFADLGKKTNLKTIGILPVIQAFENHGELSQIVCRINTGFVFKNTRGAIPLLFHYLLQVIGRLIPLIKVRVIEEKILDRFSEKNLNGDIVFFHPEFCFPKSICAAKKKKAITIGLVTMAHPQMNAQLESGEQKLLGLENSDTYYQGLAHGDYGIDQLDYLVAFSEFVRSSYVKNGFPEEKIFVAQSDVPLPVLDEKIEKEKKFQVLYVADTNMLKGLHYLLDAWHEVDIPNKELIIIGSFVQNIPQVLRSRYDCAIKNDSTILWTGHIDRSLVLEYYRHASAFVFPSLTEGNPKVVMEAMVYGLPIITTDHAQSLVENEKSGFVVPIRDANIIREKLEFLYHNPDIAKKMGHEARLAMEIKKPFGEAVFEIYQAIIKKI